MWSGVFPVGDCLAEPSGDGAAESKAPGARPQDGARRRAGPGDPVLAVVAPTGTGRTAPAQQRVGTAAQDDAGAGGANDPYVLQHRTGLAGQVDACAGVVHDRAQHLAGAAVLQGDGRAVGGGDVALLDGTLCLAVAAGVADGAAAYRDPAVRFSAYVRGSTLMTAPLRALARASPIVR